MPPLDQSTSTTSGTVPSRRDSIHTTSEATGISVRMTPTAVPSLTETLVPSLRPPTPVATKAETALLSTSADTVTPSTPTLGCSKPLPDTLLLCAPLTFPYTFSGSGDVVSLATGTTDTSVVDDTMPSHTSANKLITSLYGHISQSSTHLVNTLVPTLLEQVTTSLGKTPRTLKVTEMSSSKNPLISDSHSTSSSEMTDTGFAEATKISSHQTHSLSDTPFVTPPNENPTSSPTSGSTHPPPTSTADVRISEMPTSLGKTALPSQALTITMLLSPVKESMSALSVYTPRTEKKIVSTTSVTHPFSHLQDTSFADTITSGTTRISNPVNNNTTLSHLLSSKTQPKVSSVASPISESTQTSPETPSLSTARLSNASFTTMSPDRITTALSAPNVPTALLGKTSMATSIPIYQRSPRPVSVTAFTSKSVSDTPTVLMTESSKTALTDCLKSPSVATSGPVSEMSSMPVNDSALLPSVVSSDASTTGGSFYTLLSSMTPRSSMTMQISTLDVTPVTYICWVYFKKHRGFLSKNTEAISSIPKTTFSPFLSTTRQPSQGYEATTLGIFSGITNSSLSTVSSGKVTVLTNTCSRIAAPESVLSSTPSENPHTSLNIQVSPSLTGFKSTPGPTKNDFLVRKYFNSRDKRCHVCECTCFIPSLDSIHTEAEFSTPKTSFPPTSQMVEFPVLRTRTTSSNTQSLLMTSWSTPTAEDSQFPTSTTAHVSTPNKMETESPCLVPESLSKFTASQTGLVSGGVMAMSSISTTGILPTLGMSESPSLSISSRSVPTTLADIKHTFEKTTTSVTPGTTLPSNPSGAASGSIISKATTSPMLTWILSSLPSGSPLATISNTPHVISSSPVEVSKSTFLTSDITPTHPLTNFRTQPFAGISALLTKTTPSPTVGSITTGFPSSFPMSVKITDDSTYISKSPEAFSRITLTAKSRTVSQAPSFSRMSKSPPTIDHTRSIGAMLLPSPTTTSAWSRIPAASASPTLVLPKPTQDSVLNIATTTSTATGAPFPLIPTGVTHPSTATVSSLPSSSFETTWPDSTPSFLSMETLTSPIAVKSKVSFYNIEMSFSVFDEELRIPITRVVKEFAKNWREGQGMATISRVPYRPTNSSLVPTKLISRIKSKIHGNLTHGNFTQDQLMLLVKSEHVAVEKLGNLGSPESAKPKKQPLNTKGHLNQYQTGKSHWEKPKFKQCKLLQALPNKIVDLANVTVSDENANNVAEHILNLINESTLLDEEETKIICPIFHNVISMTLTQTILQIINSALGKQNNSASDLHEVSNEYVLILRILMIIERAGHKMEFHGRTANLTVAKLALAVLRVDHTFEGMTFSIHSYKESTDPEISLDEVPLGRVLTSIYLPKSLRERIPLSNLHTILFNFFGQTSLFKTKNIAKALTTYVVSASISDTSIQNLADPVVITLQHVEGNRNYDQVHCAFWDSGNNNGQGGWNSSGCKVKETNLNYTICQCDHLTHFGVLMDLSRSAVDAVNEQILVLITYIGCGISSIFLGQTSKRSSFQNLDLPVHSTTDAKPGISGQFLVIIISEIGPLYHSRCGTALLPARFFDLDGGCGGDHPQWEERSAWDSELNDSIVSTSVSASPVVMFLTIRVRGGLFLPHISHESLHVLHCSCSTEFHEIPKPEDLTEDDNQPDILTCPHLGIVNRGPGDGSTLYLLTLPGLR
ncbi:hypothetical protein E2I00_007733 [Balaenoptera physalus]|uniref:GAIN-B domain-containing protein n=1 Tax=Balaenoptera physalus TaxID=9770 RepID=A0A643BLA9_BALPH|nr:hypothetical protein E2I00_007733 [Balaenoptera physalus]